MLIFNASKTLSAFSKLIPLPPDSQYWIALLVTPTFLANSDTLIPCFFRSSLIKFQTFSVFIVDAHLSIWYYI